ncbi:MAG: YncE family protein [Tannerella sp.]|jgi:DNA-binding beta-propeller fold protein YncE|nr:YncE family protein [Tannerella sp.]
MKHSSHLSFVTFLLLLTAVFPACREDELVVPSEYELLPEPIRPDLNPAGMYVLNEGNMGSNKSSLDYVDFRNAFYIRNLYAERNPTVIKELGDVGNDIQIYGNKLYAVINCSHKVEVMEAATCKRIGQIDIPNCRYIRFSRGNAYVSSYVGPVAIDPDAQPGAVYRVDTASLQVTGKVIVGYQPDELEVLGEYIYVANSGGYRGGSGKAAYDSVVSVVEMYAMKQVQKIPVGINLHRIRKDGYGKLWVTSRGDYKGIPSQLFVLDRKSKNSREMAVTDTLDIPCSNLCIQGDSLYFYSTEWSEKEEKSIISYGIIHVRTKELLTKHFITDGTERDIEMPYGLQIHPVSGDIYVTDAQNYVSSGILYCYDRYGKRKWKVRTGDIPAHLVFLYK